MALAILEWMDSDDSHVWFRIDTGTNTQYQLRVGREVREDGDGEWVDDVYLSPPAGRSEGGADPFGGPIEVSVPLAQFERGRAYAQLYTWKEGGRGQTVSDVVPLPGLGVSAAAYGASLSVAASVVPMNVATLPHNKPRRIANRAPALSRATSLESLLGEIVKIASPVVMDLIKGAANNVASANLGGGASGGTGSGPPDLLGQVLKSLLGALSGTPATPPPKIDTATKTDAAPPGPELSKPKSIARVVSNGVGNRFVAHRARFAQPMIFGIDDALIASLVGPVLQILPQLANAANQKRIELRKADNQLMQNLLSDVNKRLMMDKLLEAQAAAKQQGPNAQLDPTQIQALVDLMAQLPEGTAQAKSLTLSAPPPANEAGDTHQLSNRAALEFTLGKPLQWNGTERALFDRNKTLVLKPRLVVGEPVPKEPLPKAILKIVLQDAANPDMRVEKLFKLKAVMANSRLECAFESADLSHLPQNTLLNVLAELRWLTSRGQETRAYGSTELVLVNKYFLKARGNEISSERELADMNQYRAFWNKVWEAPVLDATARNGSKKYNWELDVTAKYSTLLTGGHDSNGFMETRLLAEANDPASLSQAVRGRMKAGIELSIAELNKLLPAWPNYSSIDPTRLEALSAPPFLDEAARELKYPLKLKGRAGQGGMVWVIPTFKLFGLTVSTVTAADDTGQVNATSDEALPFPLPVAARLIGLKSAA